MRLKNLKITGLFLLISLYHFAQSGATLVDSILSGGHYRTYNLYVPTVYNGTKQVPLLLNLHGYMSNALQQQFYGNFMPIADTANFLMVYPQGLTYQGEPFWNAGLTTSPDDVQFMDDLINHLRSVYLIDIRRIYSCGMSNGAIMSYYLAGHLYNRIAAIASVAGTLFNPWFMSCDPPRPFPVMEIHGTADSIVPYAGDINFAPIDSVIRKWVLHNNCNPSPITYSVPNSNTTDNSLAVNYRYTNGTAGSSVELYKIFGGGHSWPGALPLFPNTNEDFNASVEIWRFFRQYRLDAFVSDVGVEEFGLTTQFRIYPNPSSEVILVEGAEGALLTVFATDGQQISAESAGTQLNIASLNPGVYFLKIRKDKVVTIFRFIRN